MDKITEVSLSELKDAKFLRPYEVNFKQDGISKRWEMIHAHDSVGIIIYNITRKVLVFVKQFRAPVYISKALRRKPQSEELALDTSSCSGQDGLVLELCAGIVDKTKDLQVTAREEVKEECGYQVDKDKLEKVATYLSSVGASGCEQTMFYCEVTDDMKVGEGGGLEQEGELIDVVEMTVPQVKEFIKRDQVNSNAQLMFGITWFLLNKYPGI